MPSFNKLLLTLAGKVLLLFTTEENEAIEVVLASAEVEIQKSNQLLTPLLPGEEVIFDTASLSEIFSYPERWYGV